MSKKHLYLPKLSAGANISEPSSDALWEDNEQKVILSISNGIEIDESAQTRGVSSIPDIYARPLTFLGALRSERHPLRQRVVQEWRGLLSLLALHSVKQDLGGLVISPVTFNDEKFCRALINLAPKKIQLEKNGVEYAWTDVLIIKFEGIPIGAFSPATLVYTSADYNGKLKKLPGFSLKDDEGFLKPPTKQQGLASVGKWLEHFIERFNLLAKTSVSGADGHLYVGNINKLLADWLEDIRAELGLAQSEQIKSENVKVSDEIPEHISNNQPLFLSRYGIYQELLKPLVKDKAGKDGYKSDYSLSMERNYSEFKELIIITSSLLKQNGNLWDGTHVGDLGEINESFLPTFFSGASGTEISRIKLQGNGAVWVRPELFFLSETLLKSKTDYDILNKDERLLNAGNTEYLLPFKKEILLFFSPEQIQDILKPAFSKIDGRVEFSFKLPLVSGQLVEIKKVYRYKSDGWRTGDGEIVDSEVPVLDIFPNYLGDFWCQYFILCSDSEKFKMVPVNYANHFTLTRKEQRLETNSSSSRAEIIKVSGYDSFPEALEMRDQKDALGIILLRRNPEIANDSFDTEEPVTIGVDFGTSNTNIYYLQNNNPQRLKLEFTKYVRSVLNSNPQKRAELSDNFFVPTYDIELPTPTTLRRYTSGVSENMMLDFFIYFPSEYTYPKNVFSNIKWDSDDSKMNSFIQALTFLLLVDLVTNRLGKIAFKCTYPKSFSDQRKSAYNAMWKACLSSSFVFDTDYRESQDPKCLIYVSADQNQKTAYISRDETYFTIPTKTNGTFHIDISPIFVSEGESAGHYFSSSRIYTHNADRANKTFGAVCIDVGGGTTDFSVWFENRIIYDCSIRLAGGQLSSVIKSNPRIWSLLFSAEAVSALQKVLNHEVQFSSVLNYILKKEDEEIGKRLISNVNNKDVAWLRRTLAIEFAALAFYAGHICLAIDDFSGRKLSKAVKEHGIRLHWGGNAAKFINWIDYGKYDANGIAVKFLNGMFFNALKYPLLDEERKIKPALLVQVQSKRHKDEASGGVVLMSSDVVDNNLVDEMDDWDMYETQKVDKMEGYVVGEPIQVSERLLSHFDVISKEMLFENGNSKVRGVKLEQFEEFIKLLNFIGKRTGLFPEGSEVKLSDINKTSIRSEIISEFGDIALLEESKRSIQPVFIMAVSRLLTEYSNIAK
ncbi:hypothetical protein DYBT9275_02828 [Dyadobacter sp. CECT 9275]|uniref:Uncharacterized protein n=1 Tax=Dyadobacter helix TaxID=2822344 RepID=A0A916NC37_9BACT|nr:hypothetical protein [Dyadobacter sp. CECT 9275]CAG5002177.1 hypothetical protein DYBT9275_02828 [Dyadobacter sp. CECT 9275]